MSAPVWWRLEPMELHRVEIERDKHGLCMSDQVDPDDWFPENPSKPGSKDGQEASLARAARLCSNEAGECPVRRLCAQSALNREETHGIWGGLPLWALREMSHAPAYLLWALMQQADQQRDNGADQKTSKSSTKKSVSRPRLAA